MRSTSGTQSFLDFKEFMVMSYRTIILVCLGASLVIMGLLLEESEVEKMRLKNQIDELQLEVKEGKVRELLLIEETARLQYRNRA